MGLGVHTGIQSRTGRMDRNGRSIPSWLAWEESRIIACGIGESFVRRPTAISSMDLAFCSSPSFFSFHNFFSAAQCHVDRLFQLGPLGSILLSYGRALPHDLLTLCSSFIAIFQWPCSASKSGDLYQDVSRPRRGKFIENNKRSGWLSWVYIKQVPP